MMNKLKTLRAAIYTLGAIGIVATLMMAGQGAWTRASMSDDANKVFDSKDLVADILPPPMYLIETRVILSEALEGLISPAELKTRFDKLSKEYDDRVEYWTKHPPYGLERLLLGHQHEAAKKYLAEARTAIVDKVVAGDIEGAKGGMPKVHALYVEHRTGVDETVAAATKFADEQAASFASTNALAPNIALGIALLAIALVAIVGKLVLRRMDKQLGTEPYTAVTVARRIASGNLAEPIAVEEGDTKSLMAQLKTMQESLATTVGRVRDGSDAVAASSAQIAQGNGDLSARTEQQASALEETAASMGQLSNTVKQNADSARQANQLAMSASSVAVKGGEVVAQVVDTMKSINDSSRKISDIIGVIDGIAFQTNILALNAAVEAARAGEQGRGFAVVASEVRNLAGRSAEAAKEIKNLIGDSVQRVEQGTAQVDQAGATMTEVVASIKRVTDLMGEISAASSEQSAGVAKVGQAVAEMDSNTQQNAALVEEMAASAEGLKNQAHALVQTVSVFQLGGKSAAKAAPGVQSFTERRGPNRATNVQRLQTPKSAKPAAAATRPPAATVAAKTGTTDEWTSF